VKLIVIKKINTVKKLVHIAYITWSRSSTINQNCNYL